MAYRVMPKAERPNVCQNCVHCHYCGNDMRCIDGCDCNEDDLISGYLEDCADVDPWGSCEHHERGEPTVHW